MLHLQEPEILAFSWSVVGYLVQATLNLNKENVKGVINGVSDTKKVCSKLALKH
jgi:hypothetical protein